MSGPSLETNDPFHRRIFACDRCSRRKQRCDKVLPICGQCLESRSSCVGSQRESGVVQLNDNEITRKGYVTSLQERIASLERQIQGRALSSSTSPLRQPLAESATGDENNAMDLNTLALNAMAEPRARISESLQHLSMSRVIAGMTETYGGDPEKTTRIDSLWDGIAKYIRHPASQSARLHIQRGEALKALDAYLVTVDFRFPRLPVEKVRAGIDAITTPDESTYRRMYARDPAHVFMAYMVMAIVPLVSDDYPISQGSFVSIHLLAKCMRVLDRVFGQEDGIDVIQCLHLLVIFSIHCSAAGSAWHLIGFAISKCIALGYHQEKPLSQSESPEAAEQMEQRRWVFWGCYLLDRLICSALGRPYSIDDRYISVALPGTDGRSSAEKSLDETYNIHLFRYAQFLSRAGDSTLPPNFEDSLSCLLQWRSLAPHPDDNKVRQAHLHQTSLFHTLMLRLAINEIVAAYTVESATDPVTVAYRNGQEYPSIRREKEVIEKLKLVKIVCAAAKSLDRPHMAGRHYLSLTTGYSALSIALVTLYIQTVVSLLLQTGFNEANNILGLQNVLDIAYQKLDIVGRQFPRLHDYRNMVASLRRVADGLNRVADFSNGISGTSTPSTAAISSTFSMLSTVSIIKITEEPCAFFALRSTTALVDMAPYLSTTESAASTKREKLYILSEFHPQAVKYAQSLFDCVLHTDPEAAEWRSRATAILIKDYYITEEDLLAAPQLRVIGKQGVGLDKVDVEACERHNVKICNTPGVNASAVAEMALCLAFSVARNVPDLIIRQRVDGEVIRKETISGLLLSNKTIGVVGMGNIGQAVARMFVGGLSGSIVSYDPYWPAEGTVWDSIPHRRVHDLGELLEVSDVVTLHVPLTPTTKNLIGYKQLQRMKRTAILLNTARGGIVDEEELADALKERLIWGAGFDCHAVEPPPSGKYERLWSSPGFVGTPHISAAVDETQIATINAATDGVFNFLHKGNS
ncbi:hypothetical protein BS50DRAFT_540413 [Corynespora cassiicola Philippines]|uniref:Zn(2)-C6 fungal-type domain-containing protein n=1 Tax=Corynespora cassiicola Philippines TaxID=1448308 RepID=A0A2T2PB12_CORCC|nr:hypothetical protein BS50DRAFT_540413 [Corynespora cassiicola Philippines]